MTDQPAPHPEPVYADRGSSHYDIVLTLMCVVVIISNIGGSKGVQLGPITTDGGFFLFPLAYVLGDITTEIYGLRAARRGIFMGFAMAVFAVLCFWLIIALPGFSDAYSTQHDAAIAGALGPVWQIVLASLCAFVAGQMTNSLIMVRLKARYRERGLVGRLMGSTGVGEAVDTVIFCTIAAPVVGITSFGQWANYAFFGFLWKTLVEYALIPVTTRVIGWVKKREPSYQEQLAAAGEA
ncbi:queuosine precursor transporter [Acidipropionibacterium thoenii]|uniref:queuosine precursor transporter n=1 Tax=Acidipropionibacterium thoenii TaxID=1751 RepID=UPI00042267CB|nr:queuosine precursor transporter [Acidipropionibacterium thoenii]